MKNFKAIVSVLVLAVISTACGNIQSSNLGKTTSSNAIGSMAAIDQCSSAPNVTGQGYNNDLQNQYRVCSSPSSASVNTIKIFAEDQSSKNVCVYPVRVNGSQVAIYPQYVQCTTTRNSGTSLSFGNLTFNAVYVVDSNVASQFNFCVNYSISTGSSLSACASQQNIGLNYGYGQF